MADFSDIAKFAAADIRQGVTVLSAFVLGLLLLFLPELSPFARKIVVPALAVYTIGSALIGHVQIILTVSTNTKAKADGQPIRGIDEKHLRLIMLTHGIWFLLLLVFLGWRALA